MKHRPEDEFIPAPANSTPNAIIAKLIPVDIRTHPNEATLNVIIMVVLLPKLSDMYEKIINPKSEPKYGQLLTISSRN